MVDQMSKERLKEIVNLLNQRDKHMSNDSDYSNADQFIHHLSDEGHIDWMYEQSKRAIKNAEDLEDMDRQLYSTQQRVDELEEDLRLSEEEEDKRWKQNKRYREALEFYANDYNHMQATNYGADSGLDPSAVMKDEGKQARQALEGSE